MSAGLDKARSMRIGAARLRQLSGQETSVETAREMLRIADEMDENAAELERLFAKKPPMPPNDAVA